MVGVNLVDPLNRDRLYQAAAFPTERALPRSFRVPLGRGLTGWTAQTGRSRLANDVSQEPLFIPSPGRRTCSELDVPLRVGRRTIGVLNVESEQIHAFTPDDVPYLEGVAAQLAQAIENARLAARSRELAAAEERARVDRDLHDETVQALVAIARQLDLLELDLSEGARTSERIEALQALVARTLEGVQRISRNLRPAILEDLGLLAALEAHVSELRTLGLQVELQVSGNPRRLEPRVEYAAYRVAQEALSNVARHAEAQEAGLRLRFAPSTLEIEIRDDGRGFDEQVAGPGQGLAGMRDRAREVGGDLQVQSSPGAGTLVRLLVPLELTMVDRL
jgi:signal transduction histidine kinase